MSLFADRKYWKKGMGEEDTALRYLAERKKKQERRGKEKEWKAWMILRKKIMEGQLAACYATVNRQLSSIQAENPVALQ